MSDDTYTPDDDEIRTAYLEWVGSRGTSPDAGAEFDRWLEAHDRKVYVQAVRDNH